MISQKCGVASYTPIPTVQGPAGLRLAMVSTEWHRAQKSLALPTNFAQIEIVVDGMEVGEARNKAVHLAMANTPRPEFLFSLDYDVLPSFDALQKLLYRARCYPDYDIFAGVYCCKSGVPDPLIYTENGAGPYWDWTVGDILTEGITGVHMGLTIIRMSLFDRLPATDDKPWFLTLDKEVKRDANGGLSYRGHTEDLFFCNRAIEEAGAKILVDTSVLAGHIDHNTGRIYGLPEDCPPVLRCPYMGQKPKNSKLKKCLDIGAGSTRRTWDGYETFTTDMRADCNPDFVQDSRWLNFPDNHWDMVASSHHLEHLGRWEQERVWSDMYRILKPGGYMEHIVPNVEWAAWKILDGQIDEHAYNVLYGAQEVHGYARELNTHFFGYTPDVGRELAEQCGLEDVKTLDYKQDEQLGYNLIISGRKPGGPKKVSRPKLKTEPKKRMPRKKKKRTT